MTLLINAHQLWNLLDPAPEVAITRGNVIASGFAASRSSDEWFVIRNGSDVVGSSHHPGNLADGSDARLIGFKMFDEAATESGHTGAWRVPQGKHMGGSFWYPDSYVMPEGLRVSSGNKGGTKPLKFATGFPCVWRRFGSFGDQCEAVAADGDDMCKRHRSSTDRAAAKDVERKAQMEARRHARQREKEAEQRASEILDEIRPTLEKLGHRPGLVSADSGNLSMPAEMVKALVDLAGEADDLRNL